MFVISHNPSNLGEIFLIVYRNHFPITQLSCNVITCNSHTHCGLRKKDFSDLNADVNNLLFAQNGEELFRF